MKNMDISEFYCIECGKKGLPVWRKRGSKRKTGHLKKLFCIYCNKETNHVECQLLNYTKEDFLLEYNYCNFKDGQRIKSYKKLKELINNGWTKEEIIHNGWNPRIG